MEIVKLLPAEWKAYRALRLKALREDPEAFGQRLKDAKKMPQKIWEERLKEERILFAKSGEKLLGMIRAARDRRPKRPHVAELFNLFVIPEARKRGIASKLLSALLRDLKKDLNILKVKLCVYASQKPAIKLYQKAGFKVAGRFRKEIKNGKELVDEIIMEKIL